MSSPTQYSFDVFDTVICRLVYAPDHLHWKVGRRLNRAGHIEIDEDAWRQARIAAEHEGRQNVEHGEVTLDEVYERLSGSLGLTSDVARTALKIEWDEERRLSRPIISARQRIADLQNSGTNPFFVSDTYFSQAQVRELLQTNGYEDSTQEIFVSCEYGQSKSNGDLFETVAKARGTNGPSIEHAGDNFVSDVRNAKASGYVGVLRDESRSTIRERRLYVAGGGNYLGSAIAGSARAARMGYEGNVSNGIRTAASSVVGPLMTAYVLWVMLDVLKRGGKTIYFLARDGQVLQKICRQLADWMGVEIDARYLYASRRAFFLASLPEDREQAVELALRHSKGSSISASLASMGLETTQAEQVCKTAMIDFSGNLDALSSGQLESLQRALNEPEFSDQLQANIRDAKKATLSYFESEGILQAGPAYIVDLGWKGNLQLRMQTVIGRKDALFGYYIGLRECVLGDDAPVRTWISGDWTRECILETFAFADHTSVGGFGFSPDGKPTCSPPLEDEDELIAWGVREQQDVTDLFVKNLLEAVDTDIYTPEELLAALESSGIAAYKDFVLTPTSGEAECYGSIVVSSDQNHASAKTVAPRLSNFEALRFFIDKRARQTKTDWVYASLARSQDKLVPSAMIKLIRAIVSVKTRLEARKLT